VLLGIAHDSSDLARLATDGYPFVHVGRRSVPGVEFPWVGADYRTATAQIVARLIELGHRRVGYLGYHGRMEAVIDREDGYRSACATAGIPQLPLFGRAGDLTTEWFDLAIANGMTAFVAEEEPYAERLGEFARLRGLSIPEDLSVVVLRGVSGGPRDRSWSALGVPRNEMGRRAVRLLVEILTEPDVPREHQLLLPCARPSGATIAQPRGGAA